MIDKVSKAYEPKEIEEKIYKLWEKSKSFSASGGSAAGRGGKKGKPFVVTMPPPNITGSLHMGHALNNTIQDVLTRYHRMNQVPTLWVPGIDHAGIATQNVVEKELKKEGLTRHDLGREKFIAKVWEWKEEHGDIILNQLKKLGCSCDWSKTRFTLDKDYVKAVETAFQHYYKKGWIYQGPRIVNWCTRCSTAISDIEVKYQKEKTKLWYIKYPLADGRGPTSRRRSDLQHIVVATTRPETMLGDMAIAVNPKDKRYQKLLKEKVLLPLMNREIPIVTNRLIDPEFGTGAVKVTPAHSIIDNKIGKEYKLKTVNVIGEDGKMTKEAGQYAGLKVLEARKKILEDLNSLNLLAKEEDYEHSLSLCDRCRTPIEPLISKQWFLKMKELAKPAIKAIEKDKIKFTPIRYKKALLDWMNNIDDWCISRQLWWGHKIPLKGETDVLDTWFSSALWPFAVLGWPFDYAQGKPKKDSDLERFYPTTFLTTAGDILYLWVARMIFSSLEFCQTIPFENVYTHSIILTLEGKRMSKSQGIVVNPLDLIDKYGADATRFGLLYLTSRDQQQTKFSEDAIHASRNFANKVWNISRFIEMNRQTLNSKSKTLNKSQNQNLKTKTLADKWILSRLNTIVQETTESIKKYNLGEAVRRLYDFVWHEYADWYLEISKLKTESVSLREICRRQTKLEKDNFQPKADPPRAGNPYIFKIILQLLHPFMPFITEHIWQTNYLDKKSLIISQWPKADESLIDKKAESEFEKIKQKVVEIRKKTPGKRLSEIAITKKLIK